MLVIITIPGWYSLDLDAVCAFISSDIAPGERFYMKGTAGHYICECNCIHMLKCIYGHVQEPHQYFMLCREVYQKAGLKQIQRACIYLLRLTHHSATRAHYRRLAHHWQVSQRGCGVSENARLHVVLLSGGCYDPSDAC